MAGGNINYTRFDGRPTTIPRCVCDAVFRKLHPELRQYLNFHSIYPLLKQRSLLLPSRDHSIFNDPLITREKKIDNMISWLSKCKTTDYLSPFVVCLNESAAEAGAAHKELVEDIEKQLTVELKANRIVASRKAMEYSQLSFTILITVIFVVILIAILVVPGKLEGSTSVCDIYSPTEATITIPLDSLVNRQWLRSMELKFDGTCTGKVAVIKSNNCFSSNLPVQVKSISSREGRNVQPIYIYSLPGSIFNVSIPNNVTKVVMDDPHVWFIYTLEAYRKLSSQLKTGGEHVYECGKMYEDAACFSTKANVGKTIISNVTYPNYYSIFFTNSSDLAIVSRKQFGLEWSFTSVTYNFTEIMARYATLYPVQTVTATDPASVKVSKPFDFAHTHNYCALLDFKCTDETFFKLTLSNLKRRWDIYVLLTVLYFLLLLGLILALVVVKMAYYFKTATRSRNIQSEVL